MIQYFNPEDSEYEILQLNTDSGEKFFQIFYDNAFRADTNVNHPNSNLELLKGNEVVAEIDRTNNKVIIYQRGLQGKDGRMKMSVSQKDLQKIVKKIKDNYMVDCDQR